MGKYFSIITDNKFSKQEKLVLMKPAAGDKPVLRKNILKTAETSDGVVSCQCEEDRKGQVSLYSFCKQQTGSRMPATLATVYYQ